MNESSSPDIGEAIQPESETPHERDVVIKNKILYHGSATPGIKTFNLAEEDTIGSGIYFTSEEQNAGGYAKRRSRGNKDGVPVIYKVEIDEAKLANLEDNHHVNYFMNGFKEVLRDKLSDTNLPWFTKHTIEDSISKIESGEITSGNIRDATFSHTKSFSEYLISLGYNGLIAREGGEGDDVGPHDSYVIFDPDKVSIVQERRIE